MIIGFTHKTSSVIARIFCRRFRHCVVLFPARDAGFHACGADYILIQIGADGIRLIAIDAEKIELLKSHGWIFLNIERQNIRDKNICSLRFAHCSFLTCVGFAKRAIGIKNPFIWTPDGLYKKLQHGCNFL